MDVAHDIAQHFGLPQERIVHVRDRAFNDQRYALALSCIPCACRAEPLACCTGMQMLL